ncbi:ABC transporter [Tumebacillus algifaecis]|uniref:Transport permease protein n=1 Tax=Tumebacillus algifaecis TaxID=1214604 RepID=A0A223D6I1_9BACL|nr:ABC transporter [Tumebacillus algifaecis]
MTAMLTHTKMEIKLFFREILFVFFTFLLPAVSFIFFGTMFGGETYDGYSFIDTYIPGMVSIVMFTTGFFTIGLQVVIDREKGIYKRLRGTPLKSSYVFSAIITKGFFCILIGTLEIILIAKYMFDATITDTLFQFVLAMILCSLAFFSMGFLIASIAKRMQTAMAISMVAMYPMMFLSGSTMPLDSMPAVVQTISNFIPMTYVKDLLQLGWVGNLYTEAAVMPTLVLAGIFIVGALIGVKKFQWD